MRPVPAEEQKARTRQRPPNWPTPREMNCKHPTYRLGPMKHAHVEVPQAQPAVLPHAAEAVVPVVAPPGVECHGRDPRLVTLAPRHDGRLGDGPDGDEVVLAAREDVLAVGGPADAGEPAVVRVEDVQKTRVVVC